MKFEDAKEHAIGGNDNSFIGEIDLNVRDLCKIINGLSNYYTTSSCSGRISVLLLTETLNKREAQWPYVSHEIAVSNKIWNSIQNIKFKELWFRSEPIMMHIGCRDMSAAEELLKLLKILGLKRSGIVSMHKKIIVELMGNEMLASPIGMDDKLIVNCKYIEELTNIANVKQERNRTVIKKIENNIGKLEE